MPAPEHPPGHPCEQVRERKSGPGRTSHALQSTMKRALGFLLLPLTPGTHEQTGRAQAGGSGHGYYRGPQKAVWPSDWKDTSFNLS